MRGMKKGHTFKMQNLAKIEGKKGKVLFIEN